jgi:hypothetical protein
METLSGDDLEIYRLLSKKAVSIAKKKNPERKYGEIERVLAGKGESEKGGRKNGEEYSSNHSETERTGR